MPSRSLLEQNLRKPSISPNVSLFVDWNDCFIAFQASPCGKTISSCRGLEYPYGHHGNPRWQLRNLLMSTCDLNLFNDNKQFLSIGIVGEPHRPKICSALEKSSVILMDNTQFHMFGTFWSFSTKKTLERLGMELCNWLAANTWYNLPWYLRCCLGCCFSWCSLLSIFELYSSGHLKRSNIIPKTKSKAASTLARWDWVTTPLGAR